MRAKPRTDVGPGPPPPAPPPAGGVHPPPSFSVEWIDVPRLRRHLLLTNANDRSTMWAELLEQHPEAFGVKPSSASYGPWTDSDGPRSDSEDGGPSSPSSGSPSECLTVTWRCTDFLACTCTDCFVAIKGTAEQEQERPGA